MHLLQHYLWYPLRHHACCQCVTSSGTYCLDRHASQRVMTHSRSSSGLHDYMSSCQLSRDSKRDSVWDALMQDSTPHAAIESDRKADFNMLRCAAGAVQASMDSC